LKKRESEMLIYKMTMISSGATQFISNNTGFSIVTRRGSVAHDIEMGIYHKAM
jgi:hypothetical protein